jgi:hypothetical protein
MIKILKLNILLSIANRQGGKKAKKVIFRLQCSWGQIKILRPLLTANLCLRISDPVSDLHYDIMKAPNQKKMHAQSQTGFWQVEKRLNFCSSPGARNGTYLA